MSKRYSAKALNTPVCQLKDLEMPPMDSPAIFKQSYVFVLEVNSPSFSSKAPFRLKVTDLTYNPYFDENSYQHEVYKINSQEIFNLDMFQEKMFGLKSQYFRAFGVDMLTNNMLSYDVLPKLCILKVHYKLGVFSNILEGRVMSFELIDYLSPEWQKSKELQELGVRINNLERASEFSHLCNMVMPSNVINSLSSSNMSILPENASTQVPSTQVKSTQAHQHSPSTPQHTEVIIKTENISGGLVPGNRFISDLVDDDPSEVPDSLPDSNIDMNDLEIERNQIINESSEGIPFVDSQEINTFDDIKKLKLHADNRIYTTRVKIIGTLPVDLTKLCTKGYEMVGSKLQLTDPKLRYLELLITSEYHQQLSCCNEYIKVHLDDKQLTEIFKMPLELLYCDSNIIIEKITSLMNKPIILRLFKKQIQLNSNVKVQVWSCNEL